MKIERKVSLKKYNTFRVGGNADKFFCVKNEIDLVNILKEAKKNKWPLFVLGQGSNVLIPDKGLKGLTIKIDNKDFSKENSVVAVGAGFFLPELVTKLSKLNLSGMEWAAGIPGTVGGAVYGNAGSFGKSMEDVVDEVKVFDRKKFTIKILKNKECKFSYRKSIFKKDNSLIILSVKLKLKKENINLIKNRVEDCLKQKKEKQPLNFYSAGSVFKNPPKKFAAKLIEDCGLKGKIIGGAKISEKHANFIVNFDNAKSLDIKKLISLAKKSVKKKFKINLEEEIIIF
jgi:UDP-N-acetylmuramate dehydrogenase